MAKKNKKQYAVLRVVRGEHWRQDVWVRADRIVHPNLRAVNQARAELQEKAGLPSDDVSIGRLDPATGEVCL